MAKTYRDVDQQAGLGIVAVVIASIICLALMVTLISIAIDVLTA